MAQMSDLMFEIVAADRTRAAADSAGKNMDGLAAKAANAGRATKTSMDAAKGSVSNLAAQFSDIGVQLAGGQSPFLIALQQGSQINQVLGQSGAAGAVGMLGSAFASLLNPVSLATIAVIGLGGAAVQYFDELISSGEASEETLKQQADLIMSVAKQWEGAVPALEAYVDQLARAQSQADLLAATDLLALQQFEPVTTQVEALNIQLADVVTQMMQAGVQQETISALQGAWNNLSEAVRDGTTDQVSMKAVQDELAAAINESGIPALADFGDAFAKLAEQIGSASVKAGEFRMQAAMALAGKYPSRGAYDGLIRSPDGTMQGDLSYGALPMNGPVPTGRGTPELSGFSSNRSAGRKAAKTDAEREAEAYAKVIQTLEDEQKMIGKSRTEQRALQLQRRVNVDAASEEGQAIQRLVEQIDREQDAYKQAQKAGEFMRDNLKQSMADLIPEIETGNKALDGFVNRLIQAAAEAAFFGSGPLGGTGSGGGIFGALLGGFGGGRAVGGMVEPYTDYQVGEAGPEIVRIGARGGVVGGGGQQASGGGQSVLRVMLDPNLKAEMLQEAGQQSIQIVSSAAPQIVEQSVASTGASISKGGMDAPLQAFGISRVAKRR